MKRFIAVLSGLLVLPAFAEVAPIYYDDFIEYTDDMLDESGIPSEDLIEETVVKSQPKVVQRNVAGRTVSRTVPAGNATGNSRANTSSRAVASSPRNAQQTQRGTVSRTATKQSTPTRTSVVSRSRASTTNSRTATVSARNTSTNKPVTARVSATGNVMSGARSDSGINSKILQDSGDPLYISNAARSGTGRRPTTRNASNFMPGPFSEEDAKTTTETLTNLAELTESCQTLYAQCMDNYCNVLDDNQGRCSCSENIKTYAKTEQSLATISENFQDVVQQIRYIGLSANQIEALFTETEAELVLKNSSDNSKLKNSLESIKKKIIDVSATGNGTSSLTDGLTFDLSGVLSTDFYDTNIFDLNSFLGTSKVNNQRGTALYNTAKQRCKTALNSCVAQGIDSNIITNSYDLAIDKQCMAYERSLNEANDEMRNNVRNAQNVLQQARLLLAQQRNAYDLRGCVAALDECMQDEYVCGEDYAFCLDPTGKYMSNGDIVRGGTPGMPGGSSVNQNPVTEDWLSSWKSCGMYGLYASWDYKSGSGTCACSGNTCTTSGYNAWGRGTDENLNDYIAEKLGDWARTGYKSITTSSSTTINRTTNADSSDMATYLLNRIGYIDAKEDKTYGMCASVMKQCQDYTYEIKGNSKKYIFDNEVVRQYLSLALNKIKLQQDTILADYAETCWNDVYSCLSSNSYDESATGSTASTTAINACRSDIATCMSVSGYYPSDNTTFKLNEMGNWVAGKVSGTDSPNIAGLPTEGEWAVMVFYDTSITTKNIATAATTDDNVAIVSIYALGNGGIDSYRTNCNAVDENNTPINSLRCTNDGETFLMKLTDNGGCPTSFMGKKVVQGVLVPESPDGNNTSWISISENIAQYNRPVVSALIRCKVLEEAASDEE